MNSFTNRSLTSSGNSSLINLENRSFAAAFLLSLTKAFLSLSEPVTISLSTKLLTSQAEELAKASRGKVPTNCLNLSAKEKSSMDLS